jgi:LysR family cyn operon transcriptional activator
MELRHLRYFAALAEHLSFTRAAEKIHITQSTLSHQIKQLEEEIGVRLFDRVGKRISMTEAGEALLGHVNKALQEVDDGVQAVRGVAGPMTGAIHIAATHTFNMSLIPICIAVFREAYPAVCVEVKEASSSEVERALTAEEVELGIAYYPLNPQELFFDPLYIEDMVLVVSKDHPFAARENIRLAELHRQELVLSSKESATRQMLDDRFKSAGADPIVVAEMNSVSGMISLVRRTKIGAVVSQLATTEADDLRVITIDNPKPLRTPGLLWKVTRPQADIIKAFVAIVRRVVSEANMKPPK